jgi:hypothetical protein
MAETDRAYEQAIKLAETNANLANAQHDINAVANAQRDDSKEFRVDIAKINTHLQINKAITALILSLLVGVVYVIKWIVENIDTVRDLTK